MLKYVGMTTEATSSGEPPQLRISAQGTPDIGSIADLLEWFLSYDERTSRMRHPAVEELFQWKQQDDRSFGVTTYPFDNAEARFAVGAFQAIAENDTEPKLNAWITDVLNALADARDTRTEIAETYNLDTDPDAFYLAKADKLPANREKRVYLTSAWIETLCTAEARFLGWIYQQLYNKPFTPNAVEPEAA